MTTLPKRAPVLAIALIMALGMALSTLARADEQEPRHISVTGEAERRVAPDMATLQLAVVIDRTDAANARAEADAVTERALKLIDGAGISPADRDSSGLSVAPQYRWNKSTQEQDLTGYRATRSIEVRLLDLSKLGDLLTGLSDTGVNRINPPRMGLQDEETLYQAVLAEAVRNARARAAVIAETLGEDLGGLVHATTQPLATPRPARMERAMLAADAASSAGSESYQSGHITFRVDVSASFAVD